jgi:hypothetical protein
MQIDAADRLDELKACARPRPAGELSPSVGAWAVTEIERLRARVERLEDDVSGLHADHREDMRQARAEMRDMERDLIRYER